MNLPALSLAVGLTLLSTSAQAAFLPALDVNGEGEFTYFPENSVAGWTFSVSSTKLVRALGMFDYNSDGLTFSYDVGLYNVTDAEFVARTVVSNANSTATSSTVLLSGVPYDRWLFTSVTPAHLYAGKTYALVTAFQANTVDDSVIYNVTPTTTSGVTYLSSLEDPGATSIDAFTAEFPQTQGFWGPNMSVEDVPEPGSAFLMLAGLGSAVLLHRRRIG